MITDNLIVTLLRVRLFGLSKTEQYTLGYKLFGICGKEVIDFIINEDSK